MAPMRALILGATGLLGNTLYRRWRSRPGWEVTGTSHLMPLPGFRPLDLLDAAAVRTLIRKLSPEAVITPASNPHVDYCEEHPEETRRLNVEATLAAARSAAEAGARFVFYSSDYVFDGKKRSYREEDEPSPLNVYGRQKLEVERGIAELKGAHLVLRVSGLFGWEMRGKNYVLQVLRRLRSSERVRAALDQVYSPTYVESLAAATAGLLEKGQSGLFHAAGEDAVSRSEFASLVAEAFSFPGGAVEPAAAKDLVKPGGTPRPLRSVLDSSRAAALLGGPILGARRGLEHMRAESDFHKAWEASLEPQGRR